MSEPPFEFVAAPDLNGKRVFRHAEDIEASGNMVNEFIAHTRIKAPAWFAGYEYDYNGKGEVVRAKHATRDALAVILPRARRWKEAYLGVHSTKSVDAFIRWIFDLMDLQYRPGSIVRSKLPHMVATARKLPAMLQRMKTVDFREVIEDLPTVHRALREYARILRRSDLKKNK